MAIGGGNERDPLRIRRIQSQVHKKGPISLAPFFPSSLCLPCLVGRRLKLKTLRATSHSSASVFLFFFLCHFYFVLLCLFPGLCSHLLALARSLIHFIILARSNQIVLVSQRLFECASMLAAKLPACLTGTVYRVKEDEERLLGSLARSLARPE